MLYGLVDDLLGQIDEGEGEAYPQYPKEDNDEDTPAMTTEKEAQQLYHPRGRRWSITCPRTLPQMMREA